MKYVIIYFCFMIAMFYIADWRYAIVYKKRPSRWLFVHWPLTATSFFPDFNKKTLQEMIRNVNRNESILIYSPISSFNNPIEYILTLGLFWPIVIWMYLLTTGLAVIIGVTKTIIKDLHCHHSWLKKIEKIIAPQSLRDKNK